MLVITNPLNFFTIKVIFSFLVSPSVLKILEKAIEYLLRPVKPVRSRNIFLIKLALVMGNGQLKTRSGACEVSVNL